METSKYDILYVDDEQANLDVFESTFWRDYNLHLATSAQEALGILDKQKVHLIITDQRMPSISGIEFLEQIVDVHPEPVRLLLTGFSDLDTIISAINKGKIYHYVTKPWRKADLQRTLDRALESFKLREENENLLQKLQINNAQLNDLNKNLERKVEERTAELESKNKVLNETLSQLTKAQHQVIQSEKLASLGLLAAVLGHEINSPIAVVKGGLEVIKNDIDQFTEALEILHNLDLSDDNQLLELKKGLDINYFLKIKGKIPKMLDYALEGVDRISEIIKSVKVFVGSKVDDYQYVSVHEGIESTLLLLRHVFRKSNITIERKYDPEMKKIECLPGLLNQVFMNLLSNAVDAIKSTGNGSGCIEVYTEQRKDSIIMQFSDNGAGMSGEVKEKIFDEFYSTKPNGRGTGLGLSISKSIIVRHNGVIGVESEETGGTTFTIQLPIKQGSGITDEKE